MPLIRNESFVNQRVFAALAALALFSLSTAVATVFALSQMAHARQIGVIDSTIRNDVSNFATVINTAESAQRGYILTNDMSYLAPYTKIKKALPGQFKVLNQAALGTRYEDKIRQTEPLVDQRFAQMEDVIRTNQNEGQAAALAALSNGAGHQIMDTIQANIADIQAKVNADIVTTRATIDYYANLARLVGVLALIGTLILVFGVYSLFNHAIAAERALDRAKDEFVSLASHQLRTPATGIKSILSMLEQGDFGELNLVQRKVVRKAIQSNEREIAIIEELLNVAKADAGRLMLKPGKVNLSALIDSILGEQRQAFDSKQLNLILDTPDKPVHLVADEEKLYMAISNLIDNARKYTPELGDISVTLINRRTQVVVEVADSGIGIEEHELGHIFDRFQRARMVLSGNIEGTGLGLYLARRIAELHHGTISVDSKKGQGSRFTLVLPHRTSA